MQADQLRTLIVDPVLKAIGLWTQEAADLVMGTCAQESRLGHYIKQINGPACGIYQMEPTTHDDIWQRYLPNNPRIANALMIICRFSNKPIYTQLIHDLFYATAMCRIFYARFPDAIPKTLEGQAAYYKRWYNTPLGAATPEQYIANYKLYVLGESSGNSERKSPKPSK